MGLFDSSYYDPQSYSGSSGGMLDRLLAQLAPQYQPSQGFAPNPMDANAAIPAASQNAPIAVGDYSMPRIGSGFAQNVQPMPQPGPQMPAQSQPAQMGPLPSDQAQYGQPPGMSPQQYAAQPVNLRFPQVGASQPQPQPQPTQPPANTVPAFMQSQDASGGLRAAYRGAMANQQGGLLGLVGGAIAGGLGMGTGSPQEVQRQNMRVQYQALIDAGIPKEKALLAVISPEAAKTIIPTELGSDKFAFTTLPDGTVVRQNARTGEVAPAYQGGTKPKFVQMKDGMGGDHPAFVNEVAQTVNGQPIAEYNKQQGSSAGGLGNMDLTGKEYLASLPKSEANIVQQMAEGTLPPPSSFALGKPQWVARIAAAKNYDPTFDAANWSGRVAGVRDFSAGKSSEMVRSANQTLHHVGQLLDSMDALNNGSYPLKNWLGNAADEATGGGAPGAFRTNAHAVAEELSKVFKGNNLSDTEIKSWEQNLNENMSPEQQRTQIGKLRDLLGGSLQALEEKRLNSIGPMAAEKQGPLIKPEGQRVLQRIQDWISKGTGAAQGTAPAQTKTGVSWSVVQ